MENNGKSLVLTKLKNRLLVLSPTVQAGLERECNKTDFFREGEKAVGKGGFGEVWKVIHKLTNKLYVIKVIDKKNIIEQKMVDQMNREIEIMYKVNHPHVVKLVNHYEDDDKFYLIMHYCSKGQLYSLLKRQHRFDQRTAAQFMRETIEAVRYLHSFNPPIIHRDIKPENLLLDENGRIKLADFGWSNFKNSEQILRTTYCGTPEYLAPEMVRKQGHDTSVDIWSIGVLLFELLAGHAPFSGSNQDELFSNIKKLKINWPNDFPPLAKNLVARILKINPKERISLDEIVAHSWFEKNTPLKPVLVNKLIDPKAILESHLINVLPENVSDQIDELISKPKIAIRKSRQENTDNNSQNENLLNLIKQLQNENDKLTKENNEYKIKNEKLDTDLKTQKFENSRIKDFYATQNNHEELLKLKEELEKYRIINKDRLDLLSEIEEKNNDMFDLKNKITNLENEAYNSSKNNQQLTEKNKEYQALIEKHENKISDYKNKLNNIAKEKEDIANQYQKKLEILQIKVLESSSEDSSNNLDKVVEILNDTITEFKYIFKSKIDNLSSSLSEIKEQISIFDGNFSALLNDKSNQILELINKLKHNLEDDISRAKLKILKENPSKSGEIIEWLKKQINELQPYKNKVVNFENKIYQLEGIIKVTQTNLDLSNIELHSLNKVIELKDSKINDYKTYTENLEAKLSDVKDFVFRHCADQLDQFNHCFQNYYN